MTRVIVHAGFHKTGTSSLQDFLHQNKMLLAPYLDYYGKKDFLDAGAQARMYAQRPFYWRLRKFRKAFRNFLESIPDAETIVISRETFTGGMPGHRRFDGRLLTSYQKPARKLLPVIADELRYRFGQDVDITFFFTLREKESWIKSVYGHLLRSIRLKDSFDEFRQRFPNLLGPTEEAQKLAQFLAPIPVSMSYLEDWANQPEGPAGAILDLLDVPDSIRLSLTPSPQSNVGQPKNLRDAFLSLNKQNSSKHDLKHAKEELIKKA